MSFNLKQPRKNNVKVGLPAVFIDTAIFKIIH